MTQVLRYYFLEIVKLKIISWIKKLFPSWDNYHEIEFKYYISHIHSIYIFYNCYGIMLKKLH